MSAWVWVIVLQGVITGRESPATEIVSAVGCLFPDLSAESVYLYASVSSQDVIIKNHTSAASTLVVAWFRNRLVGLVGRRTPRERKSPGSNPAFAGSSHISDLKIGTPVATLPGAWRYRVSTGTGRPGVSIL